MVDQAAPERLLQHGDGEDEDQRGPLTAPGGWSSLLTWRKPKSKPQQHPPPLPRIPSLSPTRTPLPSYSPPSAQHRPINRSRAPIPFDVVPRRTASSSSAASNSGASPKDVDDGNNEDVNALSSAFAILAKVQEKDGGTPGTLRSNQGASSPSRPSTIKANAPSTPDSLPPGGWLAWGTSRLRYTMPRGMSSALLISDPTGKGGDGVTEYESGNDTLSSPASSSVPSTLSSEKWRAEKRDDIDRHVDRIVGFAGVDGESRSIVTLTAPCLPPSDQVSHDAILQRLLSRTLPLVEDPGGYTLILFASGADLIDGTQSSKTAWPGWTWCWKAWRSLGRSYRKNLKRLYIVHPTRFTRTLVRLISTGTYFISPKFARKIVQLDSLEALNGQVPLSQLDIPPEVLIWDLKMGAKEDVTASYEQAKPVPALVRDCVSALKGNKNNGQRCLLDVEGIFRVSPSNALLRSAKYAYRLTPRPNFARFVEKDDHLPAALLKDHLRQLPSPLFPASVYGIIESCPTASGDETLAYVRDVLLPTLGEEHLGLLSYVLQCLHEVSLRSAKNRMDVSNLAVVLTPNLVHSGDAVRDVKMCRVQKEGEGREKTTLGTVMAFCIERYYEVFDEFDYDLPVLNFQSERGDLGNLKSSKRASSGPRHVPSSPPRMFSPLAGAGMPASPSPNTPTTVRSSNSIRLKNRLLSGGSFRSGLSSSYEKGNQSVALVATSATGEFERGTSSSRPSSSMDTDEEADSSFLSLPLSPSPKVRKVGSNAELSAGRHDRRPLSEVFEE